MKTMSYKKWAKPTVVELKHVLNKIAVRNNMESFDVPTSQFKSFIRETLGVNRDTAKTYCTNVEKMRFPVWVILNAMAGNDLSELISINRIHEKEILRSVLGEDAFKVGKDFRLSDYSYGVMFKSSYALPDTKVVNTPLVDMERKDFADMLSINYTVLSRNIAAKKLRLVHGKILMLIMGFTFEEVGL
ncbi:hypothetical protein ACTTZI_004153 [Vibrio vulnificus]